MFSKQIMVIKTKIHVKTFKFKLQTRLLPSNIKNYKCRINKKLKVFKNKN